MTGGSNITLRRTVATGLILVLAAVGVYVVTRSGSASADQLTSVEGLAGKAVGDALGLDPFEGGDQIIGCEGTYAEYDGKTGAGFCLSDVTDDPVEEKVLALQINGYEATDLVWSYAEALEEQSAASAIGADTQEHADLLHRLSDLREQLDAQGKA